MSHPHAAVAALSFAICLSSGALAQDTYTQGASPRPRAPAESVPTTTQPASDRQPLQARDIQAAVETEIHHDVMLSLDNVSVSVDGHTATLSGAVDSLMAKSRAAQVTATVKGVGAVINKLTVRPGQRRGEELEAAVTQALVVSPAAESFQVRVQAEPDGAIRLSGSVDSRAERDLVERAASTVAGVTRIQNDLEVRQVAPRTDREIATEVKRMLHWDGYVDDAGIDVDVRNGEVTLSGSVNSVAEKNRATTLAWTAGTKAVDINDLRVADGGTDRRDGKTADLSDAAIQNAVEARLGMSPYTPEPNMRVRIDNRVVTLSGTVANLKAKRVANLLATQTNGVLFVRNRLGVRSTGAAHSDTELKDRVDGALAVNAITESYEIDVQVRGGKVTLAGQVDNWFEKGAADDVAASVRGVRSVDNDLEVENSGQRLAFDPYVDPWSIYDYEWYQPTQARVWEQDSMLAREIEQELRWSPFVDANDIDVEVEKGVATLTGTVSSVAESNAAQENAIEGGAAGVVNKLRVTDHGGGPNRTGGP